MKFELDAAWVLAVFLMACRLAGIFLMSPIFGFASLPTQVRVIFVLLLAVVVTAPAGVPVPPQGLDLGGLVLLSAVACLQGALIGAALRAAISAFGFGGQLVDFQMGLSAAAVLNPATQLQSSLISTLMEMLGALLFLAMDMHHVLIRGLAEAFRAMPAVQPSSSLLQGVIDQSSLLFVYGLALVMPIVVGLFLVDVTIAVISRSMPQINIYFVALPIKGFAGLALFAMSLMYMGPMARRIFNLALGGMAPAGG